MKGVAHADRRSLLEYHAPRVMYGLHEAFILFAFDLGARRSRLVLRASALAELCRTGIGQVPGTQVLGFPLVLGELLRGGWMTGVTPHVLTGQELNQQFRGSEWALRHYRAYAFTPGSMRFEAGPRVTYGTRTTFFNIENLMALANEGLHANRRSRLSTRR